MSNLNNEHLELVCELQYRDLRLSSLGKLKYMLAQDLIRVGLAMESTWKHEETEDVLAVRYLHLTERGQRILEQLELEFNRAVMV